jgi:mono/diheme cytochrome c family protein
MHTRAIAIASLVGLSLSLHSARAEESVAAQAGHNLYSEYCEVCHGLRGKGDGSFAEELRRAPADLTTIAQRRGGVFPEAELREIIDGRRHVRGHGGPAAMPLWGKEFSQGTADAAHEAQVRDKIDSLVVYLGSIQNPPLANPAARNR